MPRVYKPDPHGKRYRKYDDEVIQKAKDAVGGGMSIRKAASEYRIPYTVLQRRIKNRQIKKQGGQTVLSQNEESLLVEKLQVCAEWGYPLDLYGLRLIIKGYLDRQGRTVSKFKDNLPGKEFATGFMRRHKENLAVRLCQNIKRSRARVSPDIINEYFDNIEETLKDIPASHIVNYDETNLSNDPGRSKIITKRGCKYPERIINQTKAAVSLMFAVAGNGEMLPCYVVYKAKHVYATWVEGGPKGTRFNATNSGWFDNRTFTDWVQTIAVPYLSKLDGVKVLIGDNLSSHLSSEVVSLCNKQNIRFVFLPGNSTHLTQPLDLAFFRPLKAAWRKILLEWKRGPGMKEPSIPKSVFPRLLAKLIKEIDINSSKNVQAGFCKAGLIPLNRNKVLDMIPKEITEDEEIGTNVENSFCALLKEMRYGDNQIKKKKSGKKIAVEAGKSVQGNEDSETDDGDSGEEQVPDSSGSEDENHFSNESSENSNNTEEEDMPEATDATTTVHKFGKTFANVSPIDENEIKLNQWLLVGFPTETKKAGSSKTVKFFICQVQRIVNDEFVGNFLRQKETKNACGYIYQFPAIKELTEFSFDQVVGKLEEPEKYLRGYLKFAVNFKTF